MFIVKHKWWFVGFSGLLVAASIVIAAVFGLNFGVEFAGGTVTELQYVERPAASEVTQALSGFDFNPQVQTIGDDSIIIRTRELSDADREVMLAALSLDGEQPTVTRSNTVGPSVGKELRAKSVWAIVIVAVLIVLYIAFVFRKVSRPVSSWKYGVVAIATLLHDIIIPIGVFALLGWELSTLFIVGVLSILGLSINDTIVVFDRVRERLNDNRSEKREESFEVTVGQSIRSTMGRSINTSLTILIALVVLFVVGPAATHELALVMIIGMLVGAYSSIFVASPLLVMWQKKEDKTSLK